MLFDQIKEIVLTRQSVRGFTDKPIEKEKLETLLELSKTCPSACNSQPWKMYCVTSKDKVKAVCESLQDNGKNPFASTSPAFIAVAEKKQTKLNPGAEVKYNNDHFIKYDVGELVAYITLIAKGLDLDTSIIGWINDNKLKSALKLPDDEICNLVICIGYSNVATRNKVRKDSQEVIKYL